ncbi:hypothetical protein BH18ACT9_BH18ACT9_17010 [soil metagenome]
MRLVIVASLIGTSLEWYDFFIYGTAAALVFNELFSPSFEPLVGTLLAFATYAVRFVARPLGGVRAPRGQARAQSSWWRPSCSWVSRGSKAGEQGRSACGLFYNATGVTRLVGPKASGKHSAEGFAAVKGVDRLPSH